MADKYHRWRYDEEPRRATGRLCARCGLEFRRRAGGVSWRGSQEMRPPGGEWTAAPEVPTCAAPTQAVLYPSWKVPA